MLNEQLMLVAQSTFYRADPALRRKTFSRLNNFAFTWRCFCNSSGSRRLDLIDMSSMGNAIEVPPPCSLSRTGLRPAASGGALRAFLTAPRAGGLGCPSPDGFARHGS